MLATIILMTVLAATPGGASDGPGLYKRAGELYAAGSMAEAAEAFEKAREAGFNPALSSYNAACAWARAGNTERALVNLEGLARSGYTRAEDVKKDADFASIRKEPRYLAAVAQMEKNLRPCEGDPMRNQFDFWVGQWKVFDRRSGQPAGESRVEKALFGCVLVENWRSAGGAEGKSLNIFDAQSKTWRQFWVSSTGGHTVYEGSLESGAMRLVTSNAKMRMTFTPMDDGSVRQHGEQSSDAGKTWTTGFDLRYVRVQ